MNPIIIAATIVLLFCLFLRVPVFVSLILASLTYFVLDGSTSMQLIAQRFTSGIESVPLLAVPFFIYAGVLMNYCGITESVMDVCCVLAGRLTGGLAQVNILLSVLMGGLSGSNIADAAMEAKMLVPEMEKKGFSKPFSTVVTAFSSIITPIIPPGIQMILYGTLAGVSIGRMFIAGIAVGSLACVVLMIGTAIISKKRGYKPLYDKTPPIREFLVALKRAFLPLCLPIVIIGGIRIGIFTPTEAGAVAVIYSVFLGIIYRKLTLNNSIKAIAETVVITGSIMLIVGAASILAWVFAKEQVPQAISALMMTSIQSKVLFLIIVNIFLLFVGMFIEGTALTIILAPLLAPVAASFGIDSIQFAFIFIFNLSIGCLTPPLGTLMFVTCGITGCKTKDFLKESVPYFIMLGVVLLVLTFVPAATTAIIKLFY
ncbi:MAG: TRAP transporter large permease [Treponema sp.]|jgi:tripartite ATP-independent transporter DctM subunit|nr:TRAP transporter large permease [Treponema sp.]